jgi:hypothetical protein
MSQSQSPTRSKAQALRRMRPTTANGPRYGVVGSILFHGLIVAAALVSFSRNLTTPEDTHVVPVDLVTIADKTNVQAQAPTPQPEPEKLDIPVPAREAPPEPDMQDVEPAPVPPVPQFDVQKEKKPPVEKPVEKPVSKKDSAVDFDKLLNKLTTPDKPVKNAKQGPRVIQGIGAGNMMTADLVSALQSQIYRCWSPPTGAPNAADLVVDYDLRLNRDGTVASLQLQTLNGNPYTRAAAEAASRAIYQCQPYRLPPDRYSTWQEIDPLHFDPRKMMEQ